MARLAARLTGLDFQVERATLTGTSQIIDFQASKHALFCDISSFISLDSADQLSSTSRMMSPTDLDSAPSMIHQDTRPGSPDLADSLIEELLGSIRSESDRTGKVLLECNNLELNLLPLLSLSDFETSKRTMTPQFLVSLMTPSFQVARNSIAAINQMLAQSENSRHLYQQSCLLEESVSLLFNCLNIEYQDLTHLFVIPETIHEEVRKYIQSVLHALSPFTSSLTVMSAPNSIQMLSDLVLKQLQTLKEAISTEMNSRAKIQSLPFPTTPEHEDSIFADEILASLEAFNGDDCFPFNTSSRDSLLSPLVTPRSMSSTPGVNMYSKSRTVSPLSIMAKPASLPLSSTIYDETKNETLKNIVNAYLENPGNEVTIVMMHPKVVQKSYNSEKRFLCPPPCCQVFGSAWKLHNDTVSARAMSSRSLISMVAYFQNPVGGSRSSDSEGYFTRALKTKKRKIDTPRRLDPNSGIIGTVSNLETRIDFFSTSSSIRDSVDNSRPVTTTSGYFKSIYANSKRQEQFHLYVDIFDTQRQPYALFKSGKIRVISKPSKKKQNIKMSGMTIDSGSMIALYNRVRSQSVTTRYLKCSSDGGKLVVDPLHWESFIVWKITDTRFDPNSHPSYSPISLSTKKSTCLLSSTNSNPFIWKQPRSSTNSNKNCSFDDNKPKYWTDFEAFAIQNSVPLDSDNPLQGREELRYGDVVCLQNAFTGSITKPLILRKVENKTQIYREAGEPFIEDHDYPLSYMKYQHTTNIRGDPVSQLHKIAFEVLESPGIFLCLNEDPEVVVPQESKFSLHRREKIEEVEESCIWTITGIAQQECTAVIPQDYRYGEDDSYALNIFPAPILENVVKIGDRIALIGQNLLEHPYRVFLGSKMAKVVEMTHDTLVIQNEDENSNSDGQVPVPILLAREDGVLFRTGQYHFISEAHF